jgi:hypothetical protein
MKQLLPILGLAMLAAPVAQAAEYSESDAHSGFVNISLGDESATIAQNVYIVPDKDGTHCTFALLNFKLEENGGDDSNLGDIVLEDVSCSTDTTDTTHYSGSKKGISLLGGTIVADATLTGTMDVYGVVKMDIAVVWSGLEIPVTFTSYKPGFGQQISSNGSITITMMNQEITGGGMATTIYTTTTTESTCIFALPHFSLSFGDDEPADIGNIIVENVKYTTDEAGTTTYTGERKNLSLAGGEIVADDVKISGTIDAKGVADINIDVVWSGLTIAVHYTSTGAAAIDSVTYDNNAETVYYNLNGLRVNTPAKGIYVKVQGGKASKVLVK